MTAKAVNHQVEGRYVQVTAAAAQTRGDVVIVGDLIGIATNTVDSGATDQIIDLQGIYDVDKDTSTAFSAGDKVYWDVADQELNSDSTNTFLGVAVESVLAAATKVQVLLTPSRLGDDEYTNADAVAAMGAKDDANALNHDRYTDAEALAAAKAGVIQTMAIPIPTTAAGTNWDGMAWQARADLTITKVYLADHTGIAADGSNYTVIDLYNETKTETIADWSTLSSADGALTAKTFADVPIETDTGDVAAGDVLTVGKADTGTGQAATGMLLIVEFTYD